jgi:hypothetical protein
MMDQLRQFRRRLAVTTVVMLSGISLMVMPMSCKSQCRRGGNR